MSGLDYVTFRPCNQGELGMDSYFILFRTQMNTDEHGLERKIISPAARKAQGRILIFFLRHGFPQIITDLLKPPCGGQEFLNKIVSIFQKFSSP